MFKRLKTCVLTTLIVFHRFENILTYLLKDY